MQRAAWACMAWTSPEPCPCSLSPPDPFSGAPSLPSQRSTTGSADAPVQGNGANWFCIGQFKENWGWGTEFWLWHINALAKAFIRDGDQCISWSIWLSAAPSTSDALKTSAPSFGSFGTCPVINLHPKPRYLNILTCKLTVQWQIRCEASAQLQAHALISCELMETMSTSRQLIQQHMLNQIPI